MTIDQIFPNIAPLDSKVLDSKILQLSKETRAEMRNKLSQYYRVVPVEVLVADD